ncbi:hypothetical protein K491DRAFT_678021 [Lophiostoma macrostomum CBS 122681]|uniref:Uncharacterized protein n=1 Tax=Lophiostoma macrostomum CBS 122681 TaxID=1314788 RepID=A0A6A6T8T4_9PLEO|nr:hypothetical protein K491DRAFT_678021 [Lophiostoma macrostomum CBS 122681]
MAGPRSLNPTCEDYHSDESDHDSVLEENFPRTSPAAPEKANVAAKRSQNSVGSERPPTAERVVSNIDVQSDSGYSSHTAATMSSADSAPSAKSQSPPAAAVHAEPNPPPSPALKKRPALGEERKRSSQQSPRKPLLSRSGSVSSRNTNPPRDRRSTVTADCTDPNCTQCVPNPRVRKSQPPSIASTLDIPYIPSDQRSQRSDPAPTRSSYISPQSPTYSRQPAPYMQGSAVIQPAQSTRRRSSSTARTARPVSYHAGDASQGYWQGMPGGSYPTPPQHGPPPALSAHYNMQQAQASPYPYGGTPPSTYYGAPLPTPPHDSQRPGMPSRNSSNYSARRPTSTYGATLITQGQSTENMPSARYPSQPQSARTERFPQAQLGWRGEDDDEDEDEDSSEYTSSSEEEEEETARARRLMPPPKMKGSTERRPSLRRPKTDHLSDRRMSQSLTFDAPRPRDPRASQVSTAATSRSTSKARPTLVQGTKAQSAFETSSRKDARITVEDSRSRRRSEQIYDKQYDLEARRRSKIYQEATAIPSQRRRGESNGQSKLRDNVDGVEAYMNRTRGSDAPFNDQVHKAAKQRASRGPPGPSDAGSTRSKGSDHKSRVSHSARTTVTNGTSAGGEIRLKVDASAPLSLQFNGDMEGRVLNINPAEDGMAEIVIASARGNETTYAGDRSSVSGNRRSTIGDRDRARRAEESSVSSRGRREQYREDERRPLGRREPIRYRS